MKTFKQLALIGPTASGKTALSIYAAKMLNAYILSLDSLSIYKEIDIVSAKPSSIEREGIVHFGIDVIVPNESFDVTLFIKLYHEACNTCILKNKNLIIVGGTSFYLKMLIEGISVLPDIDKKTIQDANAYLLELNATYEWLLSLDKPYMSSIESNDSYRIEKALIIYLQTGMMPSEYFKAFPPKPTIELPLPIYQLETDRVLLRKRIALRTHMMLKQGLIDEVCWLENKYTRSPNCMGAIGIKETLAYLDGVYDKKMLIEKITTNTARLAKRQTTFNNSQFTDVVRGDSDFLKKCLEDF